MLFSEGRLINAESPNVAPKYCPTNSAFFIPQMKIFSSWAEMFFVNILYNNLFVIVPHFVFLSLKMILDKYPAPL